jgi:quinol monooxygenase YgiN
LITVTARSARGDNRDSRPAAQPDSLEGAPEILRATLTDTRAFPGCLGLTVLNDSADPTHVVVYETWESLEHDRAYRAWRASPEGASDLGTLLAAPPTLTLFTVAEGI